MRKKKEYGYDEVFKELAKHFFGRFAKVITDYEIIKLPKKTDVLVIEADRPIREHVKVFDYFRQFNIIEFKSEANTFRLNLDLPKILIYIGGILLNEKAANFYNTTFTLVTSRKPDRLFEAFKNTIQKIKNGVYLIQGIVAAPVYVVIVNEVEGELDQELALLKEFATGQERSEYIKTIMKQVLSGNRELQEYLRFAVSLYKAELKKIARQEAINMTVMEKNIREWYEELGLKDEYEKKGKEEGEIRIICNMKAKGFTLDEISKATGYSKDQIRKLLKKGEKK